MKKLAVSLLVITFLAACEKTISFKLDETSPRLVVDGMIENDQPPFIILSNSFDYFSQITPEILLNSFVHGAQIDLSNGTKTHRLKEYSIKSPAGVDVYYYSNDSANLVTAFTGEFNKKYSIAIKVDGKEYSAVTTIPVLAKKIDSLWWKKSPNNPDTNKVILMTRVTDLPGYGNYIRYFTRTGNGLFLPGFNSVFDDQIIDGATYEVEVEQGINRNETIDIQNYSYFNRGDTVSVKFCNIDKATYDFWRTMEYTYANIGNPFASPTRVLTNMQGGALGHFDGYAVQYQSLIIPK